MTNELNPAETVPDGEDVTPAEGKANGSPESTDSKPSESIKDILSKATGREYKSDEDAIKSVGDTVRHAGEIGNKLKQAEEKLAGNKGDSGIREEVATLTKQLHESTFYADHPEYKEHQALINSMGGDPSKVVESDVFKKTFETLKAHGEIEKSKTVLQSNPRLGQVRDKMTEAGEAMVASRTSEMAGDVAGAVTSHGRAKKSAVSAVLDTYPKLQT